MIIKRLNENTVLVDDVRFEYHERSASYITFSENYSQKHFDSLNRFLITESIHSEKEYDDYFNFLNKLYKYLKEIGICLER